MVYRKKRKERLGSHGHGSRKKWRGAGHRGGRGRAGLGKKAQHLRFQRLQAGKKKGFVSVKKIKTVQKVINIGEIEKRLAEFEKNGFIEKTKNGLIFDADKAGYKILGKGSISDKIKIKASKFSKNTEKHLEK